MHEMLIRERESWNVPLIHTTIVYIHKWYDIHDTFLYVWVFVYVCVYECLFLGKSDRERKKEEARNDESYGGILSIQIHEDWSMRQSEWEEGRNGGIFFMNCIILCLSIHVFSLVPLKGICTKSIQNIRDYPLMTNRVISFLRSSISFSRFFGKNFSLHFHHIYESVL